MTFFNSLSPNISCPPNASSLPANSRYWIRVLSPTEMTSALISAWQDLEARAVVPNPFLSPHFVLPALRHLKSSENVFGVFVQKASAGAAELVGVALFEICGPARRFPLSHLSAFETIHSYLTDFLLDREHASSALQEIFHYLRTQRHRWHGLYLNNFSGEYLLAKEGQAVTGEAGASWHLFEQWLRAVLHKQEFGEAALAQLSKRKIKTYQKNLKKLEAGRQVEWVFTRRANSLQPLVEEFVRLEHSGWKGEARTSLYSNPNHLRFFYEMAANFNRAGRLFFTELRLNRKSIASTINFISGQARFGFKVGWDAAYAKFSPGIMNWTFANFN